jgi:RNase P/RNase MRP subunit POP5
VSPRKSSTSSGNPIARPRYLGVEVAGEQPLSPRSIEQELRRRLEAIGAHRPNFQIIRWEAGRGLVRVAHYDVGRAREAWNYQGPGSAGQPFSVRTDRTYGTLRKGKAWLNGGRRRPALRGRSEPGRLRPEGPG